MRKSGRWHFAAAVYDAPTGALHVFVDGQPDDACLLGRAAHAQTVSSAPVHIGRHGEDAIDYFRGAIDDVRLYSRALSPFEIAALYSDMRRPGGALPASASQGVRAPIRCPSPPAPDPTGLGWLVVFGQLAAIVLLGLRIDRLSRLAGLTLWCIGCLAVLRVVLSNELAPAPALALLLILAGAASILAAARADRDIKPDMEA